MEIRRLGRENAPTVLILAENADGLLTALGEKYDLLLPTFLAEDTAEKKLAALEAWISRECGGRLWGAFGSGEGGELLLSLRARKNVFIRRAVAEGVRTLPEGARKKTAGALTLWYGSRDGGAKRVGRRLRKKDETLCTLTVKKLASDERLSVRDPKLAAKRLIRALGTAEVVECTKKMKSSRARLWQFIGAHPLSAGEEKLAELSPTERDGQRFVQVSERTGRRLRLWSHLTRLEDVADRETLCTDRVELDAGPLSKPAAVAAKVYLRSLQRKRARALKHE